MLRWITLRRFRAKSRHVSVPYMYIHGANSKFTITVSADNLAWIYAGRPVSRACNEEFDIFTIKYIWSSMIPDDVIKWKLFPRY